MFDDLELAPPLSRAMNKLGIEQPTDVQNAVIPLLLERKDLLVSAQTGSGKTVAFVLPMLAEFNSNAATHPGIRALILAPTRELATQIQHVCQQLGSGIHINTLCITGGVSFQEQNALLRKNPHIVVGTPGRLKEHLHRGTLDLSDIECLVLDEADRMLDMGFRDDVLEIIKHCSPQRQSMLFSATLDHKGVLAMAQQLLNNPETVALHDARSVPSNISQQFLVASDEDFKEKLMMALLEQAGDEQIMVFTNTIAKAQRLVARLRNGSRRCGLLHGSLTQEERNTVVSGMRDGRIRVLVTTDVAARGLDLPSVGLVVNHDLARKGDEYLHRVGRTGRAGATGRAVSLIMPHEWDLMARIQRYLSTAFERITLPGLKSSYQGPVRVRNSGKAYGKKKPTKAKARAKEKASEKRRAPKTGPRPSRPKPAEDSGNRNNARDGFAPPKRRKGPMSE